MLLTILTAAAVQAAQAPQLPASQPLANSQLAQAQPAVQPKKKRHTEYCVGDEPEIGTRIIIPCSQPDEFEQLRRAHQAEQALTFLHP
jgi:hypothetical protein